MAEMYFTRHFDFTGLEALNNLPSMKKATEDFLGETFFQLRNKVINSLNPHYEEWNDEYARLYPDIPVWNQEKERNSEEYIKFICEKQDAILKQFDNDNPFVKIRSSFEEDGDLIGIGKGGLKEVTITMYFKPVYIDK